MKSDTVAADAGAAYVQPKDALWLCADGLASILLFVNPVNCRAC